MRKRGVWDVLKDGVSVAIQHWADCHELFSPFPGASTATVSKRSREKRENLRGRKEVMVAEEEEEEEEKEEMEEVEELEEEGPAFVVVVVSA
jgi:hypothetical protein